MYKRNKRQKKRVRQLNNTINAKNAKTFLTLFCLAAVTLFLSGCGQVREQLGIGRHSPDEFSVVKRAPLSLPPEYSLLPPDPNAPKRGDAASSEPAGRRAEAAVFGLDSSSATENMPPETALLERAGVYYANPEIRDVLDREAGYIVFYDEGKRLTERIMFWQRDRDEPVMINPQEEAERIQRNREDGLPLNEGETPTIRRRTGLF